jgi:4-hydroxythreonine-4-phosphate dehydrogenase
MFHVKHPTTLRRSEHFKEGNVPRETRYPFTMTHASTLPLGLTMGDPAGIGPEICLKAACLWPEASLIIGDSHFLEMEARRLQLELPKHVQLAEATRVNRQLAIGQVSMSAGLNAIACIEHAVDLAQRGDIRAIVTAPIHKEALNAAGSPFPGHTEMLAALAGLQQEHVAMMLVNDELRTLLVSIHMSLRDAIDFISQATVLHSIQLAHQAMQRAGIAAPRIAVAGLNPHAGEGGLFGREELDHIQPAIQAAQAQGINAQGPFPPDTIYMRARGFKEFDLVIAQYHDQGLIPVKYMGLDQGVNVTVGLPFVRTSVDHGTAFDLAGKPGPNGRGLADPSSMLAAMRVATQMSMAQ